MWHQQTSDLVIVGGGPSGLACAITCAMAGLEVVLVDSGKPLRDGDGDVEPLESLHPGIESLLQRLGVWQAIQDAGFERYTGVWHGKRFTAFDGGPGFHVPRSRFDKLLLERAVSLGVSWHPGTAARSVHRDGGRVAGVRLDDRLLESRIIVDASGRRQWLRRQLELKRRYSSPPLLAWRGVVMGRPAQIGDQARFLPEANSWTWLAPERSGRCTWTLVRRANGRPALPPAYLGDATPIGQAKATTVKWCSVRPLAGTGFVVCGDAGSVIDPAASQGVLMALWSGIAAGRTVVRCLAEPRAEAVSLALYDDGFMRLCEGKMADLKRLYRELGIALV